MGILDQDWLIMAFSRDFTWYFIL